MLENTLFAVAVLGSLAASGCRVVPADEGAREEDDVLAAPDARSSEMALGTASIAHAASLSLTSPDVMVNQWAEASFDGTSCNGVMIGPRTYFTAAHCGAPRDVQILFRTYRDGPSGASDTEAFTCNELIHTLGDTDGAVFDCAPNAAGQSPGDKYGYVDFDVRDPAVGQEIYSISANPWSSSGAPRDARLYATGQVTAVNGNGWFVPEEDPSTGVVMNLWAETGMSGSPHFDAESHRMIIAPLSVGGGGVTPAPMHGGWSRSAISMHGFLMWGVVSPALDPSAEGPSESAAFVRSLGLAPADYEGWVDKDLDREMDIQRDLERARGESPRGYCWLGFDSPRRNGLWDAAGIASFDPDAGWVRIQKTWGTGYEGALVHRGLHLGAGHHRISLATYTSSAAGPGALWVGLQDGASRLSGEYVQNTVGSGWQWHTVEVDSTGDGAALVLGVRGATDVLVSSITVVRPGESMDFDTADKRAGWRSGIDGSRAIVVPDGRAAGTPNWAVRVSPPATEGYPVHNRHLAIPRGRRQRICFAARRLDPSGSARAEASLWSGDDIAVRVQADLSADWTTHCTAAFTPSSGDNDLQLKLAGGDSAFLVDDITIDEM